MPGKATAQSLASSMFQTPANRDPTMTNATANLNKNMNLGHSPDPDDAFMFYAMRHDLIDQRGYHFEHHLQDIQTLNLRARAAELELTAISWHAYPHVHQLYAPMTCGASMGDGYGPMIVARKGSGLTPADLKNKTIAIPGELTTAFLTLNLLLEPGSFNHRIVMFDQIPAAVANGEADAGLLIHEGQLTYQQAGLELVVDLGTWWRDQNRLPLPLGANVVRRNLGQNTMNELTAIMHASIRYSLAHREQAVAYALEYARDMGVELADRFVGMYVNHWTLDYGPVGRRAVEMLLERGHQRGLIPNALPIHWVEPLLPH